TGTKATYRVYDRHRPYLVAPVITGRTDGVHLAGPAVAEIAHGGLNIAVGVRDLSDPQFALTAHFGRLVVFDRDPFTGQLFHAETGLSVRRCHESTALFAGFIVQENDAAIRDQIAIEDHPDAVCIPALQRHPPGAIPIFEFGP